MISEQDALFRGMTMAKLEVNGKQYRFFDINEYARGKGSDIDSLPVSIKILLENLLRHRDSAAVSDDDIQAVAQWDPSSLSQKDIAFHPARVLMQDFTGAPAVADLAAMRDAIEASGGDVHKVNPLIPVDLVVDHSVMVDRWGSCDAYKENVDLEFHRNAERYRFFKWASSSFDNFTVIPPETGIVHQVNLEYLARTVRIEEKDGEEVLYPDTCIGTDSHTTMINGLSVLGWGVGGIEAEAAMLGQPVSMLIPEVIGFRFSGKLPESCTATDLVLTAVHMLRKKGVVGKFVEFYGPALSSLSLADRATIANMAPEYGATCGMFPIDEELLTYLRLTGRSEQQVQVVASYAKAQGLWLNPDQEPVFTDTLHLDLSTVRPSLAGPTRPQDLVPLASVAQNFRDSLSSVFGVAEKNKEANSPIEGIDHSLKHGDVAIAAITSCTNTSNPSVLLSAALIAKKASEAGLTSKPWVKTSFAPGSRVVTEYLKNAGLTEGLDALGFNLVGYGCTTCIGNSGPLPENVRDAVKEGDLVTVNILSGNRNFEGRISPDSKASYLASPPLVVAYALAGTVMFDFETDPLGKGSDGKDIFLKDLWPTKNEVDELLQEYVTPLLFTDIYQKRKMGSFRWEALEAAQGAMYDWQENSTYIKRPPFFSDFSSSASPDEIKGASCLAIMPDSTTTDHISPAGTIAQHSPAGRYLSSCGVAMDAFNSYGSRRANHEVMVRGTFANIRIRNRMAKGEVGGLTLSPDGDVVPMYDAAMRWMEKGVPLIILAGKEYGTGSSRDWAAKGPLLQGVQAVIAQSFERIHRSNLVGMGILPLEFLEGDDVDSLALDGSETFSIPSLDTLVPQGKLTVLIKKGDEIREIQVRIRIDTALEKEYWRSGGILNYVLKSMMK